MGGALTIVFDSFLYITKQKAVFARALTAQVATLMVIVVLKWVIRKPRNKRALVSESTYAFPSGHAGYALVLYGSVVWYLWLIGTPIFTLSFVAVVPLCIGASRIVLRVHDVEDVLIGYLIASFFLWQMIG